MLGTFLYGLIITYTVAGDVLPKDEKDESNITFNDYMEQFNPRHVWRRIEESNKLKGINNSFKNEFENIVSHIDETEELLSIKVRNGNPRIIADKDARRQFKPPGRLNPEYFDHFSTRARLVELMKQAIFQARNKMIIMQTLRERYNKNSLYKMGFLIAKTDITIKIFALLAYRTFRFCSMARQYATQGFQLLDNLEAYERVLDLWFEAELLIDLIRLNHENCKKMLTSMVADRKHAWKFVD